MQFLTITALLFLVLFRIFFYLFKIIQLLDLNSGISSSLLILYIFYSMKFCILAAVVFLGTSIALSAADDIPEETVMEMLGTIAQVPVEELAEMQQQIQAVSTRILSMLISYWFHWIVPCCSPKFCFEKWNWKLEIFGSCFL